jgi:hypothetical protein
LFVDVLGVAIEPMVQGRSQPQPVARLNPGTECQDVEAARGADVERRSRDVCERAMVAERDHALEAELTGPRKGSPLERVRRGKEVRGRAPSLVHLGGALARLDAGKDLMAREPCARENARDLGLPEIAEPRRIPGGRGRIVRSGEKGSAHAECSGARALKDVGARLEVELILDRGRRRGRGRRSPRHGGGGQ